jgi:hypothetical protein
MALMVIATAIALVLVWKESEEERINRKFSTLIATAEIVVRRTPQQIDEQIEQLKPYFTRDCQIQVVHGGDIFRNRKDFLDFARIVISDSHKINFITAYRELHIEKDKHHAELRAMIKIKALIGKNDEENSGMGFCQVFWVKQNGVWRIYEFSLPRVKPPDWED